MARNSSISPELCQQFTQLMNQLNEALASFSESIIEYHQQCYLPQLPAFDKNEENELPIFIEVKDSPTSTITIESAIHRAFTKIVARPDENTRLAMRYPGFIYIPTKYKEGVIQQIEDINQLKAQLAALVKSSFNNRQTAHNVMHRLFPGLLYQQAIRPIYFELSALSFYFFWSLRPLVRRLTSKQAIDELEASKEFRRFDLQDFCKEEVLARIEFEKEIISRIPANMHIVERRIARVQPFYDCYKQTNENKKKKIVSRNASLPLIVFSQPTLITPLKHYDEQQESINNAPKSIVEKLIIPRKHWYLTTSDKKTK